MENSSNLEINQVNVMMMQILSGIVRNIITFGTSIFLLISTKAELVQPGGSPTTGTSYGRLRSPQGETEPILPSKGDPRPSLLDEVEGCKFLLHFQYTLVN